MHAGCPVLTASETVAQNEMTGAGATRNHWGWSHYWHGLELTTGYCLLLHKHTQKKLINYYRQMSKTFIGGAVCWEFKSEAPAAEEMLDHVICSCEQFSFVQLVHFPCSQTIPVLGYWVMGNIYRHQTVSFWGIFSLRHSMKLLGIGIARGQYYWVLDYWVPCLVLF